MKTSNFSITTVGGEGEVVVRKRIKQTGDDYHTFYQPKDIIIHVTGDQDLYVYLIDYEDDEAQSNGIYCESGNEYNLGGTDPVWKVKIEVKDYDSINEGDVIISAVNYIKTGEDYFNGII